MTFKSIHCLIASCILMILSACDNEIFIDEDNLGPVTDITLDQADNRWGSYYRTKGLTRIFLNPEDSSIDHNYITYYAVDGTATNSPCPADELARIDFKSPLLHYSINLEGRMMVITYYYNISTEKTARICFDYDNGVTKIINLTLAAGQPIQLIFATPSGDPEISEYPDKTSRTTTLINTGRSSKTFSLDPFAESESSVQVIPADSWAVGLTFNMALPAFTGHEWEWTEFKDITLGSQQTLTPHYYNSEKISVELPPNSQAKVTITLTYSTYTRQGTLELLNPVNKDLFEEEIVWTSVYPTKYDYTINYE